jgi:hypothetical protein
MPQGELFKIGIEAKSGKSGNVSKTIIFFNIYPSPEPPELTCNAW